MSQMCPNCGRDNRDTGKFCAFCNTQLMGLLGMNTMLQKRYQIVGLLGCGGMGAVYLAQDQRLGPKRVAVKENFDTSQQAQQQFQFEAHILANLDHPNLPKVTDHFIEPSGRQYLVMEYVEGEDLESMRQRHPQGQLPRKQVLVWADALLDALTYLHTQPNPVIHRDVKPDNIKITPQGKVKLVDFGIAKIYRPGQVTYTGIRGLGTPGFAPVEQYIGGTDARSDIYSLGGTLYCLLTGQIPPESAALAAGQPLPPPRQIRPDISAQTQQVIFRAMSVNAAQRFQSASEMRQALKGMAPLPTQQPVVRGPAKKAQPWVLLGFGALVVGIVLCVAGYLVVQTLLPTLTPPLPTSLAATATSPTAVVLATDTPTPHTEAPTPPTETPADTPIPITDTPVPIETPPPPMEPTVASPPVPTFTPQPTSVGAIGGFKAIGEPYKAGGISLALMDYDIASDGTIWLEFTVANEGSQKVLLRYQDNYFSVTDDTGKSYSQDEDFLVDAKQVELSPDKSFEIKSDGWPDRYSEIGNFSGKVPEQASYLIVKVSQFADLRDMQWQMPLNAQLSSPQSPAPGTQQPLLEGFSANGITVLLSDCNIESDGTIWPKFQVRNEGSNGVLLRYQDKYFEVYDDLGNKYNQDEDFLLEPKQVLLLPGKSFEIRSDGWPDRYSEVGNFNGKVPEQASHLIVKVSQFADLRDMQWRVSLK